MEWRVIVEDIGTHQCHKFADLDSLFEFIETRTRGVTNEKIEDKEMRCKTCYLLV